MIYVCILLNLKFLKTLVLSYIIIYLKIAIYSLPNKPNLYINFNQLSFHLLHITLYIEIYNLHKENYINNYCTYKKIIKNNCCIIYYVLR